MWDFLHQQSFYHAVCLHTDISREFSRENEN